METSLKDMHGEEEAYQSLDSLGPDIMRLLEDFDALEDIPGGMIGASAALNAALDTPALSLGLPHSATPSPPDAGPLPPQGPQSPPTSAFAFPDSQDAAGAAAARQLRQALAASTLASPGGGGGGDGLPLGTKIARMNIRRTRTTFAPTSPVGERCAVGSGVMLRRVVSNGDLAHKLGAAQPTTSGGTAGGPHSAATAVNIENLRLDADGTGSAGSRPGSGRGRRLKRRGSGMSSCDETETAAAAAAAAAAVGEPSTHSGNSACEAKPGDDAGHLRQLLQSQKIGYEVHCPLCQLCPPVPASCHLPGRVTCLATLCDVVLTAFHPLPDPLCFAQARRA